MEEALTSDIVAILHDLLQQVGGDPLAGSELAVQLCKLVIPCSYLDTKIKEKNKSMISCLRINRTTAPSGSGGRIEVKKEEVELLCCTITDACLCGNCMRQPGDGLGESFPMIWQRILRSPVVLGERVFSNHVCMSESNQRARSLTCQLIVWLLLLFI